MKKLPVRIINLLLILISILITGCTIKRDAYSKEKIMRDTLVAEDFDSFTKRFYTDSVFQISRIEFPLKGLHNEIVEITQSNSIGDTILYVWQRKDWTIAKTNFISNNDTSIQDCYGTKYIRRIQKNSAEVIDSVYIEDSGFITVRKFSVRNRKWYLTYYEIYNN